MNVRDENEWWKSFHVPMASLFLSVAMRQTLSKPSPFFSASWCCGRGTGTDQCCGTGALSLASWPCASIGAVAGADLCEDYIHLANVAAARKARIASSTSPML